MKKALTLSLIIPAYNEEIHLRACLDSVAAQSVLPDEVIVVDNNSTDGTRKIAQSYSFVRVVSETRQGIVYARDAGLNAAKSRLLGRIDADSILPPDWVAYIMKFYENQDPDAVCLTGGGRFYNTPFPHVSQWMLSLLAFRVNQVVLGHHFLFGSNMVIPSAVWRQIAADICVRNDIHEDIDIAIHANDVGARIVYKHRFVVGVKLRRVFQDHDKLWKNLMLWPQSLRVHDKKLWVTGFIGAALLYVLTPLIYPIKALQVLRQKLFFR